MLLQDLQLLHASKKHLPGSLDLAPEFQGVFFLDSCQRRLWITHDRTPLLNSSQLAMLPTGYEFLRGEAAYLRLLTVATGLESEIQGETNIFGQIKEAWAQYTAQTSYVNADLARLMQYLFEDTKDVRARFLQNSGGASYGGLVRKFLKEKSGEKKGPVLLVGAGQVAQSVAPWLLPQFADQEIWLWNRSPEKLEPLAEELKARGGKVRIFSRDEELQAWSRAQNVISCIPFDASQDEKRKTAASQDAIILHLGGLKNEATHWGDDSRFFCLTDLFTYQRESGDQRNSQFEQARRACEEKTKLRVLGSLSVAHGWEDLAVFA